MNNFREELNSALKYITENKKDKAIEILKNIISKDNKNFISFFYLGNIYFEKKNYEFSKKNLNQAISIKPNFAEAYNSLGLVYSNLQNFVKAEQLFSKAIEINPNIPDAYNNLGIIKRDQDDTSSAAVFFNKAIEKNKKYFSAYINLMELYERTNQNDLLEEIINKSDDVFFNNKINKLYRGKLYYKKKKYAETIKILDQLKFNESEEIFENARLLILAKSFDKIALFKDAFNYFKKMNDLSLSNLSSNQIKEKYNSEITIRKNYFIGLEDTPWKEIKYNSNEDPVFMVGFPRSGTTLLDTILSSHQYIEVLEEKPIVETLIFETQKLTHGNFSELNKLNETDLKRLQTIYFDKRKNYLNTDVSNKIIIDKLPLNIFYVPEIIRVFPKAKFIFSLRHPYDCVLSCYFQNFKLNGPMSNFLNLKEAAYFYNVVMEIWTHYNKIFKLKVCNLKYEDLVYSFESSTRKVINFLEIQWSEELYNFNEIAKKRRITTPSYFQVTEPINNKAVDRWKNYESQISEIKPIIEKWIGFFKY